MSLTWAAYCGVWEWPCYFQCNPTPHARFPTCAYSPLSCPTVYLYFWSASEDDQTGIRFSLCVSLLYMFCHVYFHVIFPIFMCLLVSNLLAWGFRVPVENAVLRRGMCSSPSKTFELPSYAAELANVLAEALSPPPSRIRPFNKLVLDFLDIKAEEGEDSDRG